MQLTKESIKRHVKAIERKIAKQQTKLFAMRDAYKKEEQEKENLQKELNDVRRQCQPHKFDKEKNPTVMGRGICIHCGTSDY